jgi:DNA-binding transcriptional MocR family regulator
MRAVISDIVGWRGVAYHQAINQSSCRGTIRPMAAIEKTTDSQERQSPPERQVAQARRVDSFLAMDVLAAANLREAKGEVTYHLEVGQPGAPTPQSVRETAAGMLADGRIGYTEAVGTKPLRERIARHYKERYGQQVDPSRVLVTTGSSASFSLAFLLLCDPGDRIALPRPGYPAYRNIVRALGLEPVEIDLKAEDGWVLTPEALAEHHEKAPIRAVLIASPNNPTGTVMPPQAIETLAAYCKQAGIWYISDEIYHGLVFDGEECCALAHDDDAIIINSFLQILLHDRLADRLDDPAGTPGAQRRGAGAEPFHLRAKPFAGCCHRRLRCNRCVGSDQGRICRQPGGVAENSSFRWA